MVMESFWKCYEGREGKEKDESTKAQLSRKKKGKNFRRDRIPCSNLKRKKIKTNRTE
jgi:hypothetical protein